MKKHLKPGSLRVTPGEQVRKGQVLAQVGFTGQTTGPHLHWHVANAASPPGAEGLPLAFAKFTQLGGYADFTTFGKQGWTAQPDSLLRTIFRERPAANAVIKFSWSTGRCLLTQDLQRLGKADHLLFLRVRSAPTRSGEAGALRWERWP